jgi:hypothetical protein
MSSVSIARKVHRQTKAAPKLELPHDRVLSSPEVRKLRKFLGAAAAMELNATEAASVDYLRHSMKTPRHVSLSADERAIVDWIVTKRHYELPPDTIICAPAQIEELWSFTECIGQRTSDPRCSEFFNWIRQKVRLFRHDVIWLTPWEFQSVEGIQQRFSQSGAWRLPIDPDGVEENDDPDFYPAEPDAVDPFDLHVWRSIDWNDRSAPELP